MTVATDAELSGSLACPRCRAVLGRDATGWRCPEAGCGLHAAPFPTVDGIPVLVDFDQSILDAGALRGSDGGSLVTRSASGSWRDRLRPLLFGRNAVAPRMADALLARLPRGGGAPPRVLVVGGGTIGQGAEALYVADGIRLVGFDVYQSPHTSFVADAHRIPLTDGSVDAVWVQAVLEHVLDPAVVVREIWRVLRPDGLVYAETPFLQQVHEGAYDFTRFTHSGHRWLFRDFAEIEAGVVAGPGTQLSWSIEHAVRGVSRSMAVGKTARAALPIVRLLDRVVPARFAVDNASAVYFFGTRSTTPLSPKAMPGYYRGAVR